METLDKVVKILQDKGIPMKAGEIADLAGIDKKEVDQAIKILKEDGRVVLPKRCYYAAR